MNPASFSGGARIGQTYSHAFNYSRPLANLTINSDEIRLKAPFKVITLRRDQVREVSAYRGIMSDGIRIEHTSSDVPPFLVFWTSSSSVAAEFRRLNYDFQDACPNDRPAPRYGFTVVFPLLVLCLLFYGVFESCMHRGDGVGDSILNATGLTAFGATIYFALRKRALR